MDILTIDNLKKVLDSDLKIKDIVYKPVTKELQLILLPSKILEVKVINNLEKTIKDKLSFLKKLEIKTIYSNTNIDISTLIHNYWDNILYEIKTKNPSIIGWLSNSSKIIENNILIIKVKDNFGLENLTNKKCDELIENILKTIYNKKIKVKFQLDEGISIDTDKYWKEKDNEVTRIVDEIITNNISIKSQNKENTKSNNTIVMGKPINDDVVRLNSIIEEESVITIEGEIFEKSCKNLKNGKMLIVLAVTDFTSSIGVKVFCKQKEFDSINNKLTCGNYYKIRGKVRYDNYEREIIIVANDISFSKRKIRMDYAPLKRVELHAHTKMSSMDGICTASDLIKRASEWGHKAIAITDHGVVQAYPEAFEASKKYGVKVIYGIEGYLINDSLSIVQNIKDNSLEQTFTIFDIETTGLSFRKDKITEIAAVKVKRGEIVDTFSTLINPGIKISEKITQITGITNEMVSNKPSIEEVLPEFINFIGNSVLVAHNASFDLSFIRENCNKISFSLNNTVLDTLTLSRCLLPNLKKHKLDSLAKYFNIELLNHHRALDDAKATAEIFLKMLKILKDKDINTLSEINTFNKKNIDYTKLNTFHINILVKDKRGLKNLYELVTHSHINTFYKRPRIPKSLLSSLREGLIIGTACEAGELFQGLINNLPETEIEEIIKFYDFLEVQPIDNNNFMIEKGIVKDTSELIEINKRIIELGNKFNKPVVATGDVHFLDPHDSIIREILMTGQGYSDAGNQPPIYFKTTEEMLDDFDYLDKKTAEEIVITNPNRIADSIENIIPIPQETFPPKIDGAEEDLRKMCYKKAIQIYGEPLPSIVKSRLDRELNSIINNGYAVMYIIAHKLVSKSLQDGYLVGSRGSVGSSFVATMSDITEVNPLPPHYICKNCKNSEFITDGSVGSGVDLSDKNCPVCGSKYNKDGHDIPFEVFLGFEGDKEPDIDLNFAGEYQVIAHKYTEKLFGKGKVFRAGTIGTLADKSGFGFAKKYYEEKGIQVNSKELLRLSNACTGIKRTTGQHPGGIMVVPHYKDIHDFTPVQYPANDKSSQVITTHFDYHAISGRLLKLDILGHDVPTIIKMLEELTGVTPQNIPLGDYDTMKIFTSTETLNLKDSEINIEVGTLGIPEFGTKFVRQMLLDTKPTTFAELVRISGLSHGTDVWINNAQELVRQGIAELKDVISTRDDIMNYLIYKGLPPKDAFNIMERVRKGKGLTPENIKIMKAHNVPDWYIDSCNKIKYMFPKAHAVAYVMMSFRIAYFKVHHPLAFYCTYFTTKVDDFDADLICRGKKNVVEKINELRERNNDLSQKEKDLLTVLEVAYEAYCRGIKFLKVDLYKSNSDTFKIENNCILPPLRALQGVGENAAKNIVAQRSRERFISIEDLRQRTKVTKNVIETLKSHGCLEGLPEENQLSLF